MFLDDTACNLASINLIKYLKNDGSFDIDAFKHACKIFLTAQDILVDYSSYPTEQIAKNSHDFRPLGLGYANLGALLMINGIPYDSEEGRAWCSSITAIMQGEAYSQSAKMSAYMGPFEEYLNNKKPMQDVIERHYQNVLNISESCPKYLKEAAVKSLKISNKLGKMYGYRNSQVSVLAPTGTIGLFMDCDTTGIEPDFSLVKYKKLAGGGSFKIVNSSVPEALKNLKYTDKQIENIINYTIGHFTFDGAPFINTDSLLKKGLSSIDIKNIESKLTSVFSLSQAFNINYLTDKTIEKLGITVKNSKSFNLLHYLGWSPKEIEEAEIYLCGTMTVEGAPHLKEEHLPVFDCANACGKYGKRYLSAESHLKMMAAAQSFISGAISKTVNIPNTATVDEIKNLYSLAWKLGIKAVAIYRDGCKMSQPLSAKSDEYNENCKIINPTEIDYSMMSKSDIEKITTKIYDRMEKLNIKPKAQRHRLPKKRSGFTQEAKVAGNKVFLRTGEYENGKVGEIFIDMHKEGASFRSLLNCFAISVSKGLQYGVPLEEFVDIFTFTKFEPHGFVEHDNIKSSTSIVDFIFRILGMEYLGRTDFVHVKPKITRMNEIKNQILKESTTTAIKNNDLKINDQIPVEEIPIGMPASNKMLEGLMGDAPPCNDCGHTTVRNGSCYRCMNCGNSMGCS